MTVRPSVYRTYVSISSPLLLLRSSIVERLEHLVLSVFCFQLLSVDSSDESQRH